MILLKSEVTHGYEEVVVLVIELNLREFLSDLSCLLDKIEIFFINGGILTVELGFLLTESLVLQVELIPALIVAALVYVTAEIDDNVIWESEYTLCIESCIVCVDYFEESYPLVGYADRFGNAEENKQDY